MSQASHQDLRVIPAQVDFLAIYNPTFGTSDETLRDQIVYYYTRRVRRRQTKQKDVSPEAENEEEENKRLRQIGLAQGMVSFANNFSSTSNVDSIETERSRIVLHELEKDWWILASIDLTRLPTSRTSQKDNSNNTVEYSAREVGPAQLLITQLIQANAVFLLHHATKLQDLFERIGRSTFCTLLEKYWDKFLTEWDVLLHGNPAVSIYNATKLSGGGELGIGVGEEEWGSGEREVLEGFIDRTEGLKDLIVGRYGLPPDTERAPTSSKQDLDTWLGTGNDPAAADGIIFSGKGVISKQSLCTISKWMESIFKYGDDAYGISENPSSRRRVKRRGQKTERHSSNERARKSPEAEVHPKTRTHKKREPDLRKRAMENNAAPPGIPAPIVGQVESSLNQALAGASASGSSKTQKDDTPNKGTSGNPADHESSSFGTDNMMKILTLGYGTSWTLNPKGLTSEKKGLDKKRSDLKDLRQQVTTQNNEADASSATSGASSNEQGLQQVDPAPEPSEEDKPFRQKLEQSIGKFLIGLSGDLEQTELDIDSEEDSDTSEFQSARLFIRTLMIAMRQPKYQERNPTIRTNSAGSSLSTISKISAHNKPPPTSAEASIDGPQPHVTHEKVRLAVYVHQPFMFVFLFDLQTANLTMPSFYRSIHNQLGPLQKPLLRSTDPARVAERIASAMGEKSSLSSTTNTSAETGNPIYDLVYDSARNTIRTSIPNIPIPGSLAAEGLTTNTSSTLSVSGSWYTLGIPVGSLSLDPASNSSSSPEKLVKSSWSRTEALNAHTQILNTYLSTRSDKEYEHTAKTSRGWWILWMKISPFQPYSHAHDRRVSNAASDSTATGPRHKEAFLVRRAADVRPGVTANSRSVSTGPGRWLLREQAKNRDVSAIGGGAASAKGVSEGVGVDAKKWVEGLLSLTQ